MKETYKSPIPGKIEENAAGMGVPSPEEVEERARELAVIAGRSANAVTDADRAEARRELVGDTDLPPEETMEPTSGWDEVPGTPGRQAPTFLPQDEAVMDERLIAEGVDEALHDEMLEARKKNIDAAS